jgi:hypothetical protein
MRHTLEERERERKDNFLHCLGEQGKEKGKKLITYQFMASIIKIMWGDKGGE